MWANREGTLRARNVEESGRMAGVRKMRVQERQQKVMFAVP